MKVDEFIKLFIITTFLMLGSFSELQAEPLKSEDTRNSIEKKFPYRSELKADLDKDVYKKDFDDYCDKFIKNYSSQAIKYTPVYKPYTDKELAPLKDSEKEEAKSFIKREYERGINGILSLRYVFLDWVYLSKDVRKSDKKMKERVRLMDKKNYNPKRCVKEPLYLTDEQKARFLNNERPYFGDQLIKTPKIFIDCLSLLDFEQRCLSCHYDLVKQDSFALRSLSDGEMCPFDIFEPHRGKTNRKLLNDLKKSTYEDTIRRRKDTIRDLPCSAFSDGECRDVPRGEK